MAIQTINSQHLYNGVNGPLDASTFVADTSDLLDIEKVPAFVGKVVAVKNANMFYICTQATRDFKSAWRPFMSLDGQALFLTSNGGITYRISINDSDEHLEVEDLSNPVISNIE